jgi:hypothetical protein
MQQSCCVGGDVGACYSACVKFLEHRPRVAAAASPLPPWPRSSFLSGFPDAMASFERISEFVAGVAFPREWLWLKVKRGLLITDEP